MLFTTKLSSLTWSGMFIHSGFPFTIPNTWSLLPLVPLAEMFPLNIKSTTLRLLVLMFSMFPVLTDKLSADKLFTDKLSADKLF